MSIAALVRSHLLDVAGGIVGTRVYPRKLPQHPTYPAITYGRISNSGQNGTSTRRESRWQIDCWDDTHLGSHELAEIIKLNFEEWYDVSETPGVDWSRVVNELDDDDDETKSYRVIIDVILHTTGD